MFNIAEELAKQLGGVSESDTLEYINISRIYENPRNFYPPINSEEAEALRESIQANGLLEPLTVVPGDYGDYRLISGHNRLRALRDLVGITGNGHKWGNIPCRVLPPMSEAQELSAVIEANRQRKKTGAVLAEEARKLTESYVERRKAGEDLPGRIRTRVAEALQVHETKLAVLSAIESNLTFPGFQDAWKAGDISESVAYELSKLPRDAQCQMWDRFIDDGFLTAKGVKDFAVAWDVCFHKCKHSEGFCPHAETIVMHYPSGCDGGCCLECPSSGYCGHKCQYVPEPESVKRFKEEQAAKAAQEAEKRKEKEQAYNYRGQQAWSRLVSSARAKNISLDEVLLALGWRSPDRRDTAEMEKRASGEIFGEGNETALYVHPFEEANIDEIVAVSDLLNESLDYLFGNNRPISLPEGQLTIAGWMPGGTNPGAESGLCLCLMDIGTDEPSPMLLNWDGALGCFKFKHGATVDQAPLGWMRVPEWKK